MVVLRTIASSRAVVIAGVLTASGVLGACGDTGTDPGTDPSLVTPGTASGAPTSLATGNSSAASSAPQVGTTPMTPSGMPSGEASVPAVNTEETPPSIVNPQIEVACPTSELATAPLRRLTRYEYSNTVRDLLKISTDVAKDFPADEIVNGFSNNAQILTVSDLHVEKYTLASEGAAKEAVKNVAELAPCAAGSAEDACALNFARAFGRRAFRRPVTSSDETMLMAAYQVGADGGSYAEGIEVMIRAALQSPDFIYRLELTEPSDPSAKLIPLSAFELATRLSYTLWGTGPDDALLDAAENGELATKDQVAVTARAMLADPKARPALAEFYNQWLGTTRLPTITKSATFFPTFDAATLSSLTQEMGAFVDYVIWTSDHKLNTLLTSPVVFATDTTAAIYGVDDGPLSATPSAVTPPDSQGRSGVLTQAGFLSVQAHPDQTSPVLRGKFVRTKLLCDPPKPPPDNVDITPPEPGEGATARERLSSHLSASTGCAGCHAALDPIGFAFENFDATGQWRATENGVTIDPSGEILANPGGVVPAELSGTFVGVRELAAKLVASESVRDCVATQWFRFAAGRTENAGDACSLARLQDSFAKSDGDLVELVVGLTQTDAFLNRAQAPEVSP